MSSSDKSLNMLYDKLFDVMDTIDGADKESIAKAKAMVEVSGAIVEVAKLEHNVAKSYGGEYQHAMVQPKQLPPPQGGEPKPKQLTSTTESSNEIRRSHSGDDMTIKALSKPLLYDKMETFQRDNKHRSPELINAFKQSNGEWVAKYRLAKLGNCNGNYV